MNTRFNNLLLGVILGFLLPVLSFLGIYLALSGSLSLVDYLQKITSSNVITKFLSLAVLPNLLLFFIFIWTNYLKSARGILGATIISAFIIIILKLLI